MCGSGIDWGDPGAYGPVDPFPTPMVIVIVMVIVIGKNISNSNSNILHFKVIDPRPASYRQRLAFCISKSSW